MVPVTLKPKSDAIKSKRYTAGGKVGISAEEMEPAGGDIYGELGAVGSCKRVYFKPQIALAVLCISL